MDAWVWVLIVVAAVVVIGLIAWAAMRGRRTAALREQFGPEYERTLSEREGRRAAESELAARRERREMLDIRPLPAASRQRYATQWRDVQSRFVDQPAVAVAEADELVLLVMRERGYPMDDFEQRAADISVDHPQVVDHYRAGHAISQRVGSNKAGTEDLRQALVHYRALFTELLNDRDAEIRQAR